MLQSNHSNKHIQLKEVLQLFSLEELQEIITTKICD